MSKNLLHYSPPIASPPKANQKSQKTDEEEEEEEYFISDAPEELWVTTYSLNERKSNDTDSCVYFFGVG